VNMQALLRLRMNKFPMKVCGHYIFQKAHVIALRIIKERPHYRFIENNCQNFGRYLIETISPNSLCPKTFQSILQGLLKAPSNNPEAHAKLPRAYPSSLASDTESGIYYTAFESVTIETEGHTDDTASKPRSESKLIQINLWENFLMNGEIESLFKVLPLSFPWVPHTVVQGCPLASAETIRLELVEFVNYISYLSACKIQATENPTFVAIRDGRWARLPAQQKVLRYPDFAACQYVQGSNSNGPNIMENRIPGEAKLFRKVRHSLLSPDGRHGNAASATAQRAVTQIYENMRCNEARYGYIMNEEELIMFRRTDRDQIDISPAIRHDVVVDLDQEIWNSKIVLFYFHWIVANDDALWRFQSFEYE